MVLEYPEMEATENSGEEGRGGSHVVRVRVGLIDASFVTQLLNCMAGKYVGDGCGKTRQAGKVSRSSASTRGS